MKPTNFLRRLSFSDFYSSFSGLYSSTSPGWQSNSRQIASKVERRTALAFPFLRIERLAGVMSTRSASSPSDILRLAIMTSTLMIIAISVSFLLIGCCYLSSLAEDFYMVSFCSSVSCCPIEKSSPMKMNKMAMIVFQ